MIGQETLDRVRRETSLVELIGESVKLERRGRSYVGICPFHKERTPSFHVNAERGFYHCFGCHASGDAIKFVQETEGIDFSDAIRRLAERGGIPVAETGSELVRREQQEARRRQQELYDIGNIAASYFEHALLEHPLSAYAKAELERRQLVPASPTGLIADALQAFRIGYAPFGWDGLGEHLKKQRVNLAAAEKVGLLVPRKTGSGYYDRFRHRLMFAVLDLQGKVVAFSGRALPDPDPKELRSLGLEPLPPSSEAPAKYVNSPESPIYRKRETVFGLYQAKRALSGGEACVVVEGNFDVVSLHARGVRNVVAPLGTAFTPEQAKQIRRFNSNVVLFFDGDSAGRRAVQMARETCRAAALTAKVATIPSGLDPDELIRQKGPEVLKDLLSRAQGMLEYLMDTTLDSGFSAADAQSQAAKINEVAALLASEEDPTTRAMAERYADRIAERLGIADARTFRALFSRMQQAARGTPGNKKLGPTVAPPASARSPSRGENIGREILGAVLDFPELTDFEPLLAHAEMLDGDIAAALAALRHARNGTGFDVEQVLAKLAPSIHSFALARITAPRHEQLENAKSELLGNLNTLSRQELLRDKTRVLEQLKSVVDFEQQMALMRELEDKQRRAMKRLKAE